MKRSRKTPKKWKEVNEAEGRTDRWDLRHYKEGALLHLKVQPNAPRNSFNGNVEGVVRLKLAAAPVKGAANAHCIKYLSILFNFPKSKIEIVRGQRSKKKWIWFKGLDPSVLIKILDANKVAKK